MTTETSQFHWPEYLMEAAELALFMISAAVFGTLLEHPGSPVRQVIHDPFIRRGLMGIAMGTTAIAIIYSRLGKQSGGHFNPAVTLTFLSLGKIKRLDAVMYIVAQFIGGVGGILISSFFLKQMLESPTVRYVATVPGDWGIGIAFISEFVISFILMTVILIVSGREKIARYTGVFAGVFVASYILLEAPLSGMSMNPARTFGSALPAGIWDAFWIYLIAPPLAMFLAGFLHKKLAYRNPLVCAKLHHDNEYRCIHCGKGM